MINEIGTFNISAATPVLKTGKICLFDADYIKYIATYMVDKNQKDLNGIRNFDEEKEVIYFLKNWIWNHVFSKIEDKIIFCFSGKSDITFRNHVSFTKKYKGKRNREPLYPNEHLDQYEVVRYIMDTYIVLFFDTMEADDVICFLQDADTYIWSKDKDLKQIPGFHYDFQTNKIYELTVKDAAFNLCYQLICGDTTDNIPGIPNFGDVKAKKFLLEYEAGQWLMRVLELYQKQMGKLNGTDAFCENWMLIKLRLKRGEHFITLHQRAFDLKQLIITQIT